MVLPVLTAIHRTWKNKNIQWHGFIPFRKYVFCTIVPNTSKCLFALLHQIYYLKMHADWAGTFTLHSKGGLHKSHRNLIITTVNHIIEFPSHILLRTADSSYWLDLMPKTSPVHVRSHLQVSPRHHLKPKEYNRLFAQHRSKSCSQHSFPLRSQKHSWAGLSGAQKTAWRQRVWGPSHMLTLPDPSPNVKDSEVVETWGAEATEVLNVQAVLFTKVSGKVNTENTI